MAVIRLENDLPGDVTDLLESYPFKEYQRLYQGISRSALAAYHRQNLERSLRSGRTKGISLAVAGEGKGTVALGGLMRHEWHSEILGREVYRLRPFVCRPSDGEAPGELLSAILRSHPHARRFLIDARVDVEDSRGMIGLIRNGFVPVGISVKLSAKTADLKGAETPFRPVTIRQLGRDELSACQDIASHAHNTSHYYAIPGMQEDRVRELFREWIARCADGVAEQVLVAVGEEKIQGFVVLLVNRGIASFVGFPLGVVDFLAVAPDSQGGGIGSALLAEGLAYLKGICPVIEVRTELYNYPAIRTYQAAGFRTTSADYVLARLGTES